MTDRTWHKGPPPHCGWWNASLYKNPNLWRWWDGACWSEAVSHSRGRKSAARMAVEKVEILGVEWTDYWPENARVPRLAPTGGHWTFNTTGKPPVGYDVRVEVMFRHGSRRISHGWAWSLDGDDWDIVAWRLAA